MHGIVITLGKHVYLSAHASEHADETIPCARLTMNFNNARLVVPGVLSVLFVVVANASAANPIQVENAKAGTSDWRLSQGARNHEIEGYANLTSVNRGGQIQFFVNTIDSNFTIEFFRTGWYGGAGGRRMTSALQLAGTAQPSCSNDVTTGLIECDWINPYTLQIPNDTSDPTNWCSGVYLAKLTSAGGLQSYIIFVVRDDSRPSDYLFQTSVNTYQAYNNWGGRSLYASNSDFQARKVSFNRPYTASLGSGQYLDYEYPGVRFLEREGYDVTYATDVDVHEKANLLLSHKADLVVGHGEYWTWEMRTNVVAARDQGVSLAILAANTCYWQVRYEPSVSDGVPDRTMVGYKEHALTEDPYYINGDTSKYHLVTTYWRAAPVNLPEDAFIGVMYGHSGLSRSDIVVNDASSWVFANTGLQNGSHLPQMLGVEVDGLDGNTPPGTTLLGHSPFQLSGETFYADMTVYTATSGATVFASGTIIWSWGLDDYKGGPVSAAVQQITRNLLARFAGGPSPVPLSSISVSPTSVTGGSSATGTVTLNGTAPSGGASVSLTSSNTSVAQVPATVTVAAGSTSATFTVTTSSVFSTTAVTLTGSYNGTKTTTLTVNPAGGGGGGGGSIALVQQKAASFSSVSSVVVTLNSAPRPGSVLVLYSANSNVSVTGVSGGGVTWVRGSSSGSHSVMHLWYGLNSSGSGTAITVTYGSAAGSGGVNVSEFSGVATANALDVAPAGTSGVSTTPTTPTAVTTNANDLILAGAAVQSAVATTAGPTNSFIALTEAANGNKIIPAYRIVTVTGSYNTSWTEANAGWDAVIVALKGASLPALSSVTVNPTSVTGGSSATGTVTLNGAAPSGGVTVSLTSSNTSAAQVPASVTVPAGATGANFTVTTSAVTNVTSVTITGSYSGASKTATLTVNPSGGTNTAPAADDRTVTTNEDTPAVVPLSASDAEQCDLQFSIVSAPSHGALGSITNASCTPGSPNTDTATVNYTPNANFNGSDSFTYRVSDGSLADTATVSITISPVNDAPVAANTSASTVSPTPVTVTLSASDPDGCAPLLSFTVVTSPANGSLSGLTSVNCVSGTHTAQVTYTPNGGFAGPDSFTYRASDGLATSNTATVAITVNSPSGSVTVTSIQPNVVSRNAGVLNFTITGTGFALGASVTFENGAGPAPRVNSVTWNSSTQLTANVEIRSGGPPRNRLWDVRVTNPDGSTGVGVALLQITP